MYNDIKDKIFKNSNLSNDDIAYLMQFFNWSYWAAKAKFLNIKRNNNSRAFDHFIRVTYLMLNNSINPSFLKVLIAMFHDIIEDSDFVFETIFQMHWNPKSALWVEIISKRPFCEFIDKSDDPKSDYQKFERIKLAWGNNYTWILNSKWILSDDFLHRKDLHIKKYWTIKKRLTRKEYLELSIYERRDNISPEEREAYDEYLKLSEIYKPKRNEEYFNRFKDFDTFYQYTFNKASERWLRLYPEEIREICMEALEIKYWDRIENLQTSEIYYENSEKNEEKAKKKIKETEKFLYWISKETHPYIYKLLFDEVERLKIFIKFTEIKWIKDETIKLIMDVFRKVK